MDDSEEIKLHKQPEHGHREQLYQQFKKGVQMRNAMLPSINFPLRI